MGSWIIATFPVCKLLMLDDVEKHIAALQNYLDSMNVLLGRGIQVAIVS